MIPRSVRHRLAPRGPRRYVLSRYSVPWQRYMVPVLSPYMDRLRAAAIGDHEWQEFNACGNTCHHPGCRLVVDDHTSRTGHEWQEFNDHGNTCHHPGCRLTEDQHPRSLG